MFSAYLQIKTMDMSENSQVIEDLIRLLDSTGELRLILEQVDNAPSQVIKTEPLVGGAH